MQSRISAFEKLFLAGAMPNQMPNPLQQPPTPIQYPQDATTFLNSPISTPRGPDPAGMIQIPEDMKRILAAQQVNAGRPYPVPAQQFAQNPVMLRQQQIQQQQQQQQGQAGRWPYYGKLMVGSLAGLMLVEALVENEQSTETPEGRGLFALPLPLLSAFIRSTHFSIGGYYMSAIGLIAKLRLFSLLGFFIWIACSPFIDIPDLQGPKNPKKTNSVVQAVPSLASPIHVRRRAWLTAIQTVWVPRHNFFLEAAALMLKTLKYTLRNLFGAHGYLVLTGLSEEQEVARIKAWTIALDAQLAGGDVEINKSRLTLTLLASGTLPETPQRLMLKALHVRVLLWQLPNPLSLTSIIAAKIARLMWNDARQLNAILNSLNNGQGSSDEELPEHLATLLEQDCDEVLNDDVIQRAHNLAWNHATTYKAKNRMDGMDAVVEDAAVRSPMDAVAAWYSSITLHRVLARSLTKKSATEPADSYADDITLAVKTAPIGSNAQVRALVARAVLIEEKRGFSIAAALQALGPSENPDRHPQYSKRVLPLIDSPVSPIVLDIDAQIALRCAMSIAQLQKFVVPSEATFAAINSIVPNANVDGMSFLGYTAAFHLMENLYRHAIGRETCSRSLERLAGALRIWVGSTAGQQAGLEAPMRQKMIDRCLAITKAIVGMENDPGYVSMDECDEYGEGC